MARRPVDPARLVALDVLLAVRERGAYANLLLPAVRAERRLNTRDAALATELSNGALRLRGTYEAILAAVCDRPVPELDPVVAAALVLGCHQLLAMRTPPYAAVSTSGELVRGRLGPRPVGFVNAVLRKVSERSLQQWLEEVAPAAGEDPIGRLAVMHSHPRWVVEAVLAALGGDLAGTARYLRWDNQPPKVTLAARPGLAAVSELLGTGGRPGTLSPFAVRLPGGDPGEIPAVREGRAGVQDEGSQVVTLALLAAPLRGPDARWLDLCAGPGGKAALMAAVGAGRGALLLANERQPHRARLVANAVRRLPNAEVVAGDGHRPAWRPGTFDRVLLDAPCSGLGALRRHPDARWGRREDELPGLVRLQEQLLETALDSARAGGVVGYVTCSPHLAETAGVVNAVLGRRPEVELLDAPAAFPQLPGQAGSCLRLWPHVHDTDAMFLALLRRRD